MSPDFSHDFTRVPITALTSCGHFILVAEGPCLLFYHGPDQELSGQRQIFKDHAIHGLAVDVETSQRTTIVVWGGPYIRALSIENGTQYRAPDHSTVASFKMSATVKATDWILDLVFGPANPAAVSRGLPGICAAVTAHNALHELRIETPSAEIGESLVLNISELTQSSRSILYSAHLLWESENRILVAAGTAFGEIILWSWMRNLATWRTHAIFLGHEGSIFGVRISQQLKLHPGWTTRRLLASCSDDRTIRIWEVSAYFDEERDMPTLDEAHDAEEAQHTGFSNALFDLKSATSACLTIGWGHLSRVWHVRFLPQDMFLEGVALLSLGEDATSRLWKLNSKQKVPHDDTELIFTLDLISTSAAHSGKNIWTGTEHSLDLDRYIVVTGAADSKITKRSWATSTQTPHVVLNPNIDEYNVDDIHTLAKDSIDTEGLQVTSNSHRSSTKSEFFRSYAFVTKCSFLLTTNSGRLYKADVGQCDQYSRTTFIAKSRMVAQLDDLAGYSICTAESSRGAGFLAGSRGSLYVYHASTSTLTKLYTIQGKVSAMFAANLGKITDQTSMALLVTVLGQHTALLLYVNTANHEPKITRAMSIPLSDPLTGLIVTSFEYVNTSSGNDYVLLGFRKGAVGLYSISQSLLANDTRKPSQASLSRVIDRAHGKETVTQILWYPSYAKSVFGQMISVGRDGCCVVHHIDLTNSHITLVHNLSLPFGPNIEGLSYHNEHLYVYGFSSTKFISYDVTAEEELMSIDTGGAHRSWAFQPSSSREDGGTLVWTRASSMHVYKQSEASHQVIRHGGHGREMKAVAISAITHDGTPRQLMATGAEDTDIKLFEFADGEFKCRRTLRKHTTGIQHLQWSNCGEYLFSSGGCEEFYIWRVRRDDAVLGIHVVCEAVCQPESEHSDLRVMSFDIEENNSGFTVALIFSDSSIKVYNYNPTSAIKWMTLAKGTYFTSCLTQCVFLSPTTILTAGTDGHAVLWSFPSDLHRPHQSTPLPRQAFTWKYPARIHQSASKTLDSHAINAKETLLVSGGDDSSLAFLLINTKEEELTYAYPPIIVVRAHASAITACSILRKWDRIFVLTSGNDQWVRLWEVSLRNEMDAAARDDPLKIKRVKKIKTRVADVSSMAVMEESDKASKVMICGVGMEVIRVAWN